MVKMMTKAVLKAKIPFPIMAPGENDVNKSQKNGRNPQGLEKPYAEFRVTVNNGDIIQIEIIETDLADDPNQDNFQNKGAMRLIGELIAQQQQRCQIDGYDDETPLSQYKKQVSDGIVLFEKP